MRGIVKVRSESELRPGMTVWLKSCAHCSRKHAYVLVRQDDGSGLCDVHADGPCLGWFCIPEHHDARFCPRMAVSQGRLYRLPDEELTSTTENTRERERETTR